MVSPQELRNTGLAEVRKAVEASKTYIDNFLARHAKEFLVEEELDLDCSKIKYGNDDYVLAKFFYKYNSSNYSDKRSHYSRPMAAIFIEELAKEYAKDGWLVEKKNQTGVTVVFKDSGNSVPNVEDENEAEEVDRADLLDFVGDEDG